MKAKALGVLAEDYTTDRIGSVEELYSEKETIENFDDEIIQKLYKTPFSIEASIVAKHLKSELLPNKYYVLKNENCSVLTYLDHEMQNFERIDKQDVYGITPRNAEQTFATHALCNQDIPLVTVTGKAGTGKTLLALASALQVRKNTDKYLLLDQSYH